ncbi:iron-sulfur cluster assembly scaffold protein [Candidatus Saccharibacteria bacterium]|nr:iron-sulfur cluster assembly scaffold protein [Candidatus Saccharibacteria bacterium]
MKTYKSSDGKSDGQEWIYTNIVKDHFLNPRNFLMGDESKFKADAVGLVGNPICGDQMKMFIKVKDDKIIDIAWKTYGCASAIASTSALSELAKGKTLDEALNITAKDIDNYLGNLPKHKFHCSILGHDALRDAIEKYRSGK